MDSNQLTPKEIVAYLDDYVIGQKAAKKAIALALRNRYRRMLLDEQMREDVVPKNILMIGSTGIGKTEIARRLAKMMGLPFVKVEASKFTEVGFVGRDVESMVRDLVLASFEIIKKEAQATNGNDIEAYILDKIASTLIPPLPAAASAQKQEDYQKSIESMKRKIAQGTMDEMEITLQVQKQAPKGDSGHLPQGLSDMQDMIGKLFNSKKEHIQKTTTIKNAKKLLRQEALDNSIDENAIADKALERAQNGGIIFIDEIDKVVSSGQNRTDPGKEGVQRDLLPIVEGSTVGTKYGQIQTDHILFIAAGAFHVSKPSDLIAELQGRFPVRVELEALDEESLYQILTSTQNSLLTQYKALLKVDGVELEFEDEAIRAIAALAHKANLKADNIGARRLHTVLEQVLEEVSFAFDAHQDEPLVITKQIVHDKLDGLVDDEDLTRYIL